MGETGIFTVAVEGGTAPYTYKWYTRAIGTTSWKTSSVTGFDTDTITAAITETRLRYEYRCMITDADNNVVYSDAANMELAPYVDVTGVSLDATEINMLTSDKPVTLTATVTPDDADEPDVEWSVVSEDAEAAVTISVEGATATVTAVKAGMAKVVVTTTVGGYTAECVFNVAEPVIPVESVIVSETEITMLTTDEPVELVATVYPENATDQSVTWAVHGEGSEGVISIEANGNTATVTALTAGTATVVVTTVDGAYSAECCITVNKPVVPVSEIVLSQTVISVLLENEETITISATVLPEDATDKTLVWSFVADEEGTECVTYEVVDDNTITVTPVAVGSGKIVACTEDETVIAECTVTVDSLYIYDVKDTYSVTYLKDIENGTATLVAYTGTETSVTIPQMIEGYTVVAVGEGAFMGNTSLTSIDLPDTIVTIGKAAFKNCSNLASMN